MAKKGGNHTILWPLWPLLGRKPLYRDKGSFISKRFEPIDAVELFGNIKKTPIDSILSQFWNNRCILPQNLEAFPAKSEDYEKVRPGFANT